MNKMYFPVQINIKFEIILDANASIAPFGFDGRWYVSDGGYIFINN